VKTFSVLVALLLAAAHGTTIDPSLPAYRPVAVAFPSGATYLTPDGAIAIIGYNDMAEMLTALTGRFRHDHPDFRFALDLKGTRTAPPALAAGKSAFAPMGAEFSEVERTDFRTATGAEPVPLRIAHASLSPRALSGPLAIFVHRDSPLTSLTLTEVAGIFRGGSPREGLEPCGLGAETALGRFMRRHALGGAEFATRFTAFPQSADVVAYVAAHPRAIGFAAYVRASEGVKALAIAADPGGAAIALTEENLVAGLYPLDRHLLLYPGPGPLPTWLQEFLRLVYSREGQELIAQGTLGYLPLNARDAAAEFGKIDRPPSRPR
jgi:phosphate transport system substrate-binding protein